MNPIFIEPTDILFFRDAIPMSAGQGSGAGCRPPFPTSFHEALRSSLLINTGDTPNAKKVQGRPRTADRSGNWHAVGHDAETFIASKAFRSLKTIGPFPWHQKTGLLLPVPLDATRKDGSIATLQLLRNQDTPAKQDPASPSNYRALCLPVATTPPDKHAQLSGWWTCTQYSAYLDHNNSDKRPQNVPPDFFNPTPTAELWEPEHRIGVEIDPGSFASKEHQLYSGAYLRPHKYTKFVAWAGIADPAKATGPESQTRRLEQEQLDKLNWLLLGGEFRLARLLHRTDSAKALSEAVSHLCRPPSPPTSDGPCLLKWVLVTPALFAHGSVPGWCADTHSSQAKPRTPLGQVCLNLPGRAQLVSWCHGKPRTASGWDVVEGRPKPTMLAVPEGSVYYFLCENTRTAEALARKLHWQPRSDFYGEKGCGYGLVSFDVHMHATSVSLNQLAGELFA
ncbi:MAG TPA: type III-B CRISPR module-associated Cmr3 family protein [Verrucomicrobiota bacterium]|nr:type III-B CRISPR module-associated Cmr3 family protein [Verrucomicrobiota bacterium]